jgi:hypothetical protein
MSRKRHYPKDWADATADDIAYLEDLYRDFIKNLNDAGVPETHSLRRTAANIRQKIDQELAKREQDTSPPQVV